MAKLSPSTRTRQFFTAPMRRARAPALTTALASRRKMSSAWSHRSAIIVRQRSPAKRRLGTSAKS
eukprot:5409155-Pyramimonas_sp.AAC.1